MVEETNNQTQKKSSIFIKILCSGGILVSLYFFYKLTQLIIDDINRGTGLGFGFGLIGVSMVSVVIFFPSIYFIKSNWTKKQSYFFLFIEIGIILSAFIFLN